MFNRYELSIKIIDQNYVDSLIIALVRQGYAPYISYEKDKVCFEIDETEMQLLKD